MMKQIFIFFALIFIAQLIYAQISREIFPVYPGKDLGLIYHKNHASFRIWSPTAKAAQLLFYKDGTGGTAFKTIDLQKGSKGTWFTEQHGNLKGTFYTFRVKINNKWNDEVPDPYAKAVGVNGNRAMVIDLKETDPNGWLMEKSPAFSGNPTDAVIYELHIRDASIDPNSGITNKGKFLGLAETGTKSNEGLATGIDHLKELGITHVHLLPFFDFNSVDESKPNEPQYNWGYDPLNYNVPEGSYSTNAYDGKTRINELKQMIQALHQNGLRVIFDAVYNHTAKSTESNFNQLVPGYYFRHNKDGSFSDATACGNETASENPMMQKFMLESVLYWVNEYHIDGFRFDLMGVHDIKTMNLIAEELRKIRPDILLYGEGWTAGKSPLPDSVRALKVNAAKLNGIAVFSDDIRDGIKGSVFEEKDRGFATGKPGMEESVKFGIVAACKHNQIDYSKVNYSKAPYAAGPWNVITYCECHDNNTLWDKIKLSCPQASEADREKMHRLALTIVLTSQGIPFLHAGTEFFRTKNGVENSYKSSDNINHIDWSLKKQHLELVNYIETLIRLRKEHPAFRLATSTQVSDLINFDESAPAGTIVYSINAAAAGDKWQKIWIAFNGSDEDKKVSLPEGNWQTAIKTEQGEDVNSGTIDMKKYSAIVMYQ